jgi:acetylornithine/succinyldiaminopimelate/putrescine aminotransferase
MKQLSYNPLLGHITTFGGNALACAAAAASLEVILEPGFMQAIPAKEQLIRKLLVHPEIIAIHGMGLLLAAEMRDNALVLKTMENCYAGGLITDWFLFADNCLRIAPPLTISDQEITKACEIILKAIDQAVEALAV